MSSDQTYEAAIRVVAEFHKVSLATAKAALAKAAHDPLASNPDYPTETYSDAKRLRGEDIVAFLERVWRPFIEARTISIGAMRAIDMSVIDAMANYQRANKDGIRRRIPDHLRLPKTRDVAAKVYGLDGVADDRSPSKLRRPRTQPKLIGRDATLLTLSRKLAVVALTGSLLVANAAISI